MYAQWKDIHNNNIYVRPTTIFTIYITLYTTRENNGVVLMCPINLLMLIAMLITVFLSLVVFKLNRVLPFMNNLMTFSVALYFNPERSLTSSTV